MALFIGGPMDGQHIEVTVGLPIVEVTIPEKYSISDIINPFVNTPVDAKMSVKKFTYRMEVLSSPGKTYSIYVPKDFTCVDIMDALLNGYKNNS